MKTVGYTLIAVQVFAYISGNVKIHDGPTSAVLGELIGSNIFAIIGIVLIIQANNKEKKKQNKDKIKDVDNETTTSESTQTK